MAKRLNILYSDLQSQLMPFSEPDLILLEFAVNDYQGQDHLITIDHKISVFFDGFQDLVLCAEVVIHSLLTRYPNAAVVFVEVQTAIVTRKSGSLLHLGVAQQYGIPVVSYAETMFSEYYRLVRLLEGMDDTSYSFPKDMWMKDGGIGRILDEQMNRDGVVVNASQYASAALPYPHGCSPCQDWTIISQFRQGEYILRISYTKRFFTLYVTLTILSAQIIISKQPKTRRMQINLHLCRQKWHHLR
jgi:hypothetical protein